MLNNMRYNCGHTDRHKYTHTQQQCTGRDMKVKKERGEASRQETITAVQEEEKKKLKAKHTHTHKQTKGAPQEIGGDAK